MRKGFDGLAVLVQQVLQEKPHSGALFAFRGKRGDLLIGTLHGQIARMRRMQFGASSEKLSREIAQRELALEELETESAVPEIGAVLSDTPERRAPVRTLPDHLPREKVVHDPASGACTCPDCGGALRHLREDAQEMLDVLPVPWRVGAERPTEIQLPDV